MRVKRQRVVACLVSIILVVLVVLLAGTLAAKSVARKYDRDKSFIVSSIESAFLSRKDAGRILVKLIPEAECRYGEFLAVGTIDGIPRSETTSAGKVVLVYQVIMEFKNAPATFIAKVSSLDDSVSLVDMMHKPGHFPHRRIRTYLAGILP